jgi:hypothetical protein
LWKSAKQPIVATSSTEAEYIACTEAVKEGLWICRIIGEIRRESLKEPLHYSHKIDAQDLLESLSIKLTKMDKETLALQIIFADN